MPTLAKLRPQVADRPPRRVGSAGSPPFYPTAENKALVKALAGTKMTQAEIAAVIINPHTEKPISIETLRKYFMPELEAGWASLKSLIGRRYMESLNAGQVWAIRAGLRHFYGWKNSGGIIPVETATPVAGQDGDEAMRELEHLLSSIRAARPTVLKN
jgi:hypothetical protein